MAYICGVYIACIYGVCTPYIYICTPYVTGTYTPKNYTPYIRGIYPVYIRCVKTAYKFTAFIYVKHNNVFVENPAIRTFETIILYSVSDTSRILWSKDPNFIKQLSLVDPYIYSSTRVYIYIYMYSYI